MDLGIGVLGVPDRMPRARRRPALVDSLTGKIAAMVSILATAYFATAAVVGHVVMTQYNFFSDLPVPNRDAILLCGSG
jgi:hypothetical protein